MSKMDLPRRVLASILNWNSAASTIECVDSLLRQRLPAGVALEIWVIDNGSAAPDVALLAEWLAGRPVQLRREASNHGFAGGHNLALQHALASGVDFAWLVNSDAEVAHDDVLAAYRSVLGDAAWVAARDEVIAEGWYGPVPAEHLDRIGDVVVVCLDRTVVLASGAEPPSVGRLVAYHGSVTAAEMTVPLLSFVRPAG